MATTNILLLEPVSGLGGEGDEVSVKSGFARNFLFPKKIALPVNHANTKYIDSLKRRRAEREAKEIEGAQEIAKKLEAITIAISVKTGEGGKMFGSVTAGDLLERLKEEGVELEKKQVSLYSPVKSLGKHTTKIKLHSELKVEFEFEVVSENPIEEAEAAAEDGE